MKKPILLLLLLQSCATTQTISKKDCQIPLGTYQVTTISIRTDIPLECPIDTIHVYQKIHLVELLDNDQLTRCGTWTITDGPGTILKITTTRNGLSGIAQLRIDLSEDLYCYAFFSLKYEKISD